MIPSPRPSSENPLRYDLGAADELEFALLCASDAEWAAFLAANTDPLTAGKDDPKVREWAQRIFGDVD